MKRQKEKYEKHSQQKHMNFILKKIKQNKRNTQKKLYNKLTKWNN